MRKFFVPAALVLSLFAAACASEEPEVVEEAETPEIVEPAPVEPVAPAVDSAVIVDTAAAPAPEAGAEAPAQH